MTPTLSATVVARNEERFIGQALAGINSQTLVPDEVVVVDDASTDRTREIVEAFDGPAPIRYFRHETPLGSIAARNRAIAEACGDLIAECDADDIWLPEKLERQVRVLLDGDSERIAVLGCAGRNITENGADVGTFSVRMTSPNGFREVLDEEDVLMLPHSSVVFRRSDFQRVGGYQEDYLGAEDVELWERMAQCGLVLNLPDELFLYRKKRGGLMQTVFWKQQVNELRVTENRKRAREGLEPLSFEAFTRHLHQEPRRLRWSRWRQWYGTYFYRFGASNLVNGRRAMGGVQLAIAAALEPARVKAGLARYARRRPVSDAGSTVSD